MTTAQEMKVGALAPWFGSNRMLAPKVGKLLDGCAWVGIPFSGGMSELPHITARTVAVNDVHRHIINLALTVACPIRCAQLVERLDATLFHPDALANAQDRCRCRERERPAQLLSGCVDWAVDYFVCAWVTRHGQAGTGGELTGAIAIRWNASGGDNVKHFRGGTEALKLWQKVMSRCTFTALDCFEFLEKCKDADGHGVYCDPPFPGPGDGYKHKFTEAEHRRLAKTLSAYAATRVVCRFYDHPLVRELYPEPVWQWRRLEGRKQTNAAAPEVLIVNGPKFA